MGRFPIVQAKEQQWPEITGVTWYTMALSIASKNQGEFFNVYALCSKKLQVAEMPAQYASTYIRGPAAVAPQQFHAVPPPPPPRRPGFHVTTNTRTIEFVPETILSTDMYDENVDSDSFEC